MLDRVDIEAGVTSDFNGIKAPWVAQLNIESDIEVSKIPAYKPVTIARKSAAGWNKGTMALLLAVVDGEAVKSTSPFVARDYPRCRSCDGDTVPNRGPFHYVRVAVSCSSAQSGAGYGEFHVITICVASVQRTHDTGTTPNGNDRFSPAVVKGASALRVRFREPP
jgi:hypothetical protein